MPASPATSTSSPARLGLLLAGRYHDPMRRRLPIALIAALAPTAASVALLASPAFAYHDTLGGGASIAGGALIGVILPIVVVVVLLVVGVGMWGRKKGKTKSKRRKRRRGRH